MACILPLLVATVFVLNHAAAHRPHHSRSPLPDEDVQVLTSMYNLQKAPIGNFLFTELYKSSDNTTLSTGETSLASSYLVLLNGDCDGWMVFPESDRVYTWVDGKAWIDLAKPDGTIETVSLGDSLLHSECQYSVTIPATWKVNYRPDGFFIFTATVIKGAVQNLQPVPLADMETQYGNNYPELIKEASVCY